MKNACMQTDFLWPREGASSRNLGPALYFALSMMNATNTYV